ncbi:TVP38/TMEM64 family protein [Clostridium ganghwense]|uniref:TVP38/TMEM64 family membrane protein n=1 Tax=Clostridium ganghwense TaxID=312089 RepID=A0ABT4CL37_9CLOT|nr:VTT domain-containing protein [Clostridium ganghwense]MCY6369752.1 VTT domain-containing protein [Clostridium ganghwense]
MLRNIKDQIIKYKGYIILIIVLLFLIISGYEYYYKYSYILKDPEKLKTFIMSYGKYSILVFFIIQVIQVVAFFIPGEIVQIAGGYIFGAGIGGIISLGGITGGSILVYLIANEFGKPFVEKIVSEKKINFLEKILKAGSKRFVIFLLYLIPGLPKDIFGYICGVSDISLKDFAIYSTLGRIPGIFVSAYFGSKMFTQNMEQLIFIAVIMSILFIIGVLKGDNIIRKIINSHKKAK